jgi:hypothetical protein
LEFYHEASGENYVGRCVDLSEGGLLMYVPVRVPIQVNQVVRLTPKGESLPEFAGQAETPIEATIVRVDRHSLLTMGHVAVGVKFVK